MKKLFLILCIVLQTKSFSQDKPGRAFFTGNINFVLGVNENYTLFQQDDDESLIIPTAIFARIGFGYEFKKRVAISFNSGYDYHWNYAVSAIPAFGSLQFNLWRNGDDIFFIDTSYGKMFRMSKNYADGNYYGLGLGYQIAGENRWNTVIRFDLHRKGIIGFKNNRLDSFSIGIGFSFF